MGGGDNNQNDNQNTNIEFISQNNCIRKFSYIYTYTSVEDKYKALSNRQKFHTKHV